MIYWIRELEIQLEELLESLEIWDLDSLARWMRNKLVSISTKSEKAIPMSPA